MRRKIGKGLQAIGYGMRCVGEACLLIAAIVGMIAFYVLLIFAAAKDGGRGCGNNNNGFFTGFLLGSFCFHDSSHYRNSGPSSLVSLLVISFIVSLVAVFLAFYLGVPMIGALVALAWAAAMVLVGLGMLLELVGETLADVGATPVVPAANGPEFTPEHGPQIVPVKQDELRPVIGEVVELAQGAQPGNGPGPSSGYPSPPPSPIVPVQKIASV